MRGGKDGSGVIPGGETPARSPTGLVGPETGNSMGKGRSHDPARLPSLEKAKTLVRKQGKTIGPGITYTKKELDESRANADRAGLGFYGIHDDATLTSVLNGGKYNPLDAAVPPPTNPGNPDTDDEMEKRKSIRAPVAGAGPMIGGGEPQPQRPVLAISNYFRFCHKYNRREVQPYYDHLLAKIRGYLKSEEEEDEIVKINAMQVMTASMHHADSGVSRKKILKEYPSFFRAHMIDLFGDDNLRGIFNVHLCDTYLECDRRNFKDLNDFVREVELPSESSSFDIFDVQDRNIQDQLTNFVKNNSINFIYFIGGETHWLNRQLTLCKFKEVLNSLKDTKIVFGGFSAGLINLGSSSYITACKNYKFPSNTYFDDVSDLCDADGKRIAVIDEFSGPDVNNPKCAPESTDQPVHKIKYDTLGVSPHVYFPHFDMAYINFLEDVGSTCGDNANRNKANPNIVLTDGMMAYTDESGYTGFIFAEPDIEVVLSKVVEDETITESQTYSRVLETLGDWSVVDENKDSFQKYGPELLAYCHSLLSIPLDHQIGMKENDGNSSDEESGARIVPRGGGGARSSNICGAVVGLVIAVAAAFVRR
jgi:hypothetical protein